MKFEKRQIPNYLTIIRILTVPIIITLALTPSSNIVYTFETLNSIVAVNLHLFIAGILFILSSLTDWFDGYLARKYQWITDIGKLWDPIADKLLINSVFLAMASSTLDFVPIYLVILMVARDLIVEGYRVQISSKGIIVAANIWGKMKTFTQMFAIIFLFFIGSSDASSSYYFGVQNLLVIITTFLSLLSGIIYIKDITNVQKQIKC